MRRLRALVVDDEPLARRGVVQMLAGHPDVEVVGEAASAEGALAAVRALAPDLLFLDIQMPAADGFDLLGELGAAAPLVVFVTAYEAFAVRAYETDALDYLLKPLEPGRFARAMERVRQRLRERPRGGSERSERLVVPGPAGLTVLGLEEIERIEAEDYYAAIHARGRRFLLRESLARLAERLAPHGFVRLHRSVLAPLGAVVALRRGGGAGEGEAELRSGERVPVSRRRLTELERRLREAGVAARCTPETAR